MSWQAYRLLFRVLSPIHIGFERIGNLQRTRPYVLGRNLWAAAAAKMVLEGRVAGYEEARSELAGQYCIGYLFPTLSNETVFAPCYGDDGLFFGLDQHIGQREFEHRFLSSTAHTALNPASRGAEEGSLHEVECLLPRTRPDGRPTYLAGVLFARRGTTEATLRSLLDDLQVGGERTYGMGRLRLESAEPTDGGLFPGFEVDRQQDRPIARGQGPIPAHWLIGIMEAQDLGVTGEIEILIGRDTCDSGYGVSLSRAAASWCPGSVPNSARSFRILPQGLWEELR
jgi:hypothetical protein